MLESDRVSRRLDHAITMAGLAKMVALHGEKTDDPEDKRDSEKMLRFSLELTTEAFLRVHQALDDTMPEGWVREAHSHQNKMMSTAFEGEGSIRPDFPIYVADDLEDLIVPVHPARSTD
jgi:hypothetical protein